MESQTKQILKKSTAECRRNCDVYDSWQQLESDNIELVLKIRDRDVIIKKLVEANRRAGGRLMELGQSESILTLKVLNEALAAAEALENKP